MSGEGVTFSLNGRDIHAARGQLVIDAAERHGVFVPRFCYHPRMRSVGMCRMCIVDIDTGRGPALQPSCMVEVAEGMKVDTESAATRKAQDGVLEFLLVNHPLDCPVCDKGGECPLQDNAYAYGPGESRFVEEKRHFEKPIPVSDLVLLDRERCILCDRCTRFAKEVAGDPLIHFINRGAQTEVNTFPDDPFASYFSGNTVQICPVGALTAKPYRFKARPWDLEVAESTCVTCSVGCRVTIEASRNHVLRYQGVDSDPVNWSWMCDRGRFDFEAIESDARLTAPLIRKPARDPDAGDELVAASWSEALAAATAALEDLGDDGPAALGVIGGARLTNEAAYAWAKLIKGVLGSDNVDCQLGDGLPAEVVLGLPGATIDEVCAAGGTVVVVAPDLKEELPVLFLRLRDAVLYRGVKVVELAPTTTGLTPLAAVSLRHRPGEAGEAMRALLGAATGVKLDPIVGGDVAVAARLLEGPVVAVVGRTSLAESPAAVVEAAAVLLDHKPGTRFLVALRRGNVRGALDLGLAPGLLPGRVTLDDGRAWFSDAWGQVPAETGLDTAAMLAAAADGRLRVLVLLGADPVSDFPDRDLALRALAAVPTVIAVDNVLNASSEQADIVLAASGYAENRGTTTNVEGRVTVLEQRVTPPGTSRPDWMIAAELAIRLGDDLGVASVEDLWAEIEQLAPAHAGATLELVRSRVAVDGVLVPVAPGTLPGYETPVSIGGLPAPADAGEDEAAHAGPDVSPPAEADADLTAGAEAALDEDDDDDDDDDGEPAPAVRPSPMAWARPGEYAAPPRDAYGLRLVAVRSLYDRAVATRNSPSLAALARPSRFRVNPAELDRLGVAAGDRLGVSSSNGRLTVEAEADDTVPAGAAVLTVNQEGPDPAELIDSAAPVTDLRVETT
ncbi:MAG: NADH-quinone oxidoreductase subunit NuoG [Acidimicrobiia bacterium]